MKRIYVGGGSSFVWQWQPKEQIVLEGYPEGVYVHYANCDTVEAPVVQSRMEGDKLIADIPPELMQVDKDITVYVCDVDGTKHCHFLSVLSRPKPESYVTEPVEVLRYESLAERVAALEKGGTGGGGGAGNWDELDGKPTYMQGTQEKFDPAWLPDGGVGWTETGEAAIEWDGRTEGLDVVAVGSDTTLVRVSGLLPSAEAMIGRTVEMADGSSFEVSTETVAQAGPVWVVYSPVSDDFLPILYGVGATEFDGVAFPDTGLYAVLYQDQPYRFAKVTIAHETIHGLDARYLPEEAVREYVIELDYSKTVVTGSDKYGTVGKILNDLSYTKIRDAYASGQRLVVRLRNTDYPETYLRLVNVGDREWRFEADVGHQYTADRIRKLYLTLINQDVASDTVTARVAYINIELGGDTEQVQADWGQNDPEAPDYVKGRTHYEENNQTVVEWDGSMDTTGSDYFEYGRSTFVKISDITPGVSELDSAIISMTADGNAQSFVVKDAYGDSSNWWLVQNKVIDFGGMVLIVHDTDIEEGVTETAIPSTGTYFNLNMLNMFAAERLSLTYGSTVVHPLDEKWIPDSIARKTDIPELDGITPHIGANGNWWIGEGDTGVRAQGPKGDSGRTPVKGTDYFTHDEIEDVARQAADMVEVPDGGGEGFRLVNTIDIPASEEPFYVILTESDDGEPYHEEEFVVEITSMTYHWAYYTISVKSGDVNATISDCRGQNPRILRICRLGTRYVGLVYHDTSINPGYPFDYQKNPVQIDYIDKLEIGPFKQFSARVYARRKEG